MKKLLDKYTYRVEWSEEDQAHIGSCLELPSLKAHGKTPEQALKQIRRVVKETLLWMQEGKETIPEPFGLKSFNLSSQLTLVSRLKIDHEVIWLMTR